VNIQPIFWTILGGLLAGSMAVGALPEANLTPEAYAQRRSQWTVQENLTYRTVAADVEKYRGAVLEMTGSIHGRIEVGEQVVLILHTDGGETVYLKSTTENPAITPGMTVKALARVPSTGAFRELELLAIVSHRPSLKPAPAEPGDGETAGDPANRPAARSSSGSFPQVGSRTESPAPPSRPTRRPPLPSRGRSAGSFGAPIALASEVEQAAAVIAAYNPRVPAAERQAIAQGIVGYARMFGLRWEFLAALVAAESNFNRTAVSSAGAQGLGQLMPSTAASLGVADPFDIFQNLYGSARYIRAQLDRYAQYPSNQQFALALAAYNAGPNAVAKYGGVPPYPQTINYINRVTQIYLSLCPETQGSG